MKNKVFLNIPMCVLTRSLGDKKQKLRLPTFSQLFPLLGIFRNSSWPENYIQNEKLTKTKQENQTTETLSKEK